MTAEAADAAEVSVIIPVRDGAAFIEAAIASVHAQTLRAAEIIVVDDGSSDDSGAIARAIPGVRVLSQQTAGVSAARNAGVAASRGRLIAFLDADDIWLPEKLELQAAVLRRHPEIGIVLGHADVVVDGRLPPPENRRSAFPARAGRAGERIAPAMSMMLRREVWDQVGEMEPSFTHAEDTDWILRARNLGIKLHILGDVVMRRRLHEANASHQTAEMRAGLIRALRRSIERHRDGSTHS